MTMSMATVREVLDVLFPTHMVTESFDVSLEVAYNLMFTKTALMKAVGSLKNREELRPSEVLAVINSM